MPVIQALGMFAALIAAIMVAYVFDAKASPRGVFHRLKRRLFPPSEVLEGYEQPELVDLIFRKTVAFKPAADWPEIAGASTVLDFGGGCGLHYKQAASPDVRWAVVDTPAMVARARELSTDHLQFFTTIKDAAAWLGPIDVVHSNGAIQYAPNPSEILRDLCALRATKMLWYRVLLGEGRDVQTSYLGDNGPGTIPVAEKVVRFDRSRISEHDFLAAHEEYKLVDHASNRMIFHLLNSNSSYGAIL